MLSFVALSLVLFVLAWLVPAVKSQIRIWRAWAELPRPKGNIAGHFKELIGLRTFQNLHDYLLTTEGICGLRALHTKVVVVNDPVLAHELVQINDAVDKGRFYHEFDKITSKALPSVFSSTSNGYWRAVRKGVAPAFNGANLKQGFSRLKDLMPAVIHFVKQAGPGTSINVDNIAGSVTMDAISLSIFGKTMDCVDHLASMHKPHLAKLVEDAMTTILTTMTFPWVLNFNFIPVVRKMNQTLKDVRAEHQKLLHDLRTCNPPPSSLGAHLLALKDPQTGQPISDDQLESHMAIFVLAGFDTSTTSITWALYAIATHPEVQRKITKELQQLGLAAGPAQPTPRQLEWEDLGKLEYLRSVIKEAMRLWPVASNGTGRVVKKDLQLGGYDLPAGTDVLVNFYSMHRNPKYFERPTEFLPERWDVPNAEYVQPRHDVPATADVSLNGHAGERRKESFSDDGAAKAADGTNAEELWKQNAAAKAVDDKERSSIRRHMPFSLGLRNCVGQNLANTTVISFVATMCSHFHVELAPEMGGTKGVEEKTILTLTLHVEGGLQLRFVPRA